MQIIAGKEVFTTLEEIADPAHTALLVVDVQNEFCSPGGLWVHGDSDLRIMARVVANVRRLIDAARAARVRVMYIRMAVLPGLTSISPAYLRFMLVRNNLSPEQIGCAPGTRGAEIVDEIAPQPGEIVIQKWRSSAFVGTNLDLLLRSSGIKSVVVCGVITQACVESTARDAFSNDYYVVLVEDCVGGFNQQLHEASLAVMRSRFDVVTCDELASVWAGQASQASAAGLDQSPVIAGGS